MFHWQQNQSNEIIKKIDDNNGGGDNSDNNNNDDDGDNNGSGNSGGGGDGGVGDGKHTDRRRWKNLTKRTLLSFLCKSLLFEAKYEINSNLFKWKKNSFFRSAYFCCRLSLVLKSNISTRIPAY